MLYSNADVFLLALQQQKPSETLIRYVVLWAQLCTIRTSTGSQYVNQTAFVRALPLETGEITLILARYVGS